MPDEPSERVIVVEAGNARCAFPLGDVLETMRPAAVRAVAGTPPFVAGVALVRGAPTPVVDLAALLSGAPEPSPTRWVTLRCGARAVALAVRRVVGVAPLPEARASAPLLEGAAAGAVESLRALDGELLVVLTAGRVAGEEVMRTAERT